MFWFSVAGCNVACGRLQYARNADHDLQHHRENLKLHFYLASTFCGCFAKNNNFLAKKEIYSIKLYACKARPPWQQVKNKLFIDFYPCWVSQISVPVFPYFPEKHRTMQRINCGQNCVNYSLSSANEFGEKLVPSTLDKFVLFYSILFYFILFYSILFYSILFYSILNIPCCAGLL